MFSFRSIYFDDKPRTGRIIDIFDAPDPSQNVALFFIHGGGWKGGSRSIFHPIIHAYCARGFDCASVDYRLSGVDVFEQVADVREGLDLFIDDLSRRKRPTKVLLIGSSAGAHIALLTGLTKPQECGTPAKVLLHQLQIVGIAVQAAPFTFEPWDDIFPAGWQAMQAAVGAPYDGNAERFRKASPMTYINQDSPPIFSLYAENEHMFPHEQCEEFARKYRECGNIFHEKIYPRTEHGFFYSLDRWQQCEAFEDIAAFAADPCNMNSDR